MIKRQCPNCGGKLEVTRLMCSDCRAEYPIAEGLSPYDYLNNNQLSFLETFLRCKGNLKSVGEMLNISYPTVKKRFDDLLVSLGYAEEKNNEQESNVSDRENEEVRSDKADKPHKTPDLPIKAGAVPDGELKLKEDSLCVFCRKQKGTYDLMGKQVCSDCRDKLMIKLSDMK